MNLGDLEFTGIRLRVLMREAEAAGDSDPFETLARLLNADLRERLEKAPEVYFYGEALGTYCWSKQATSDTHRARIVCIEKIGGINDGQ